MLQVIFYLRKNKNKNLLPYKAFIREKNLRGLIGTCWTKVCNGHFLPADGTCWTKGWSQSSTQLPLKKKNLNTAFVFLTRNLNMALLPNEQSFTLVNLTNLITFGP